MSMANVKVSNFNIYHGHHVRETALITNLVKAANGPECCTVQAMMLDLLVNLFCLKLTYRLHIQHDLVKDEQDELDICGSTDFRIIYCTPRSAQSGPFGLLEKDFFMIEGTRTLTCLSLVQLK